jgi:hypothetical protein
MLVTAVGEHSQQGIIFTLLNQNSEDEGGKRWRERGREGEGEGEMEREGEGGRERQRQRER